MKDEEDVSLKTNHLSFSIGNFRFVIGRNLIERFFFNDKSKITNGK
jgi:hypothetical protein